LKRLIIFILLMFFMASLISGCKKTGGSDISKVHKMLSELHTYTATAEIIVRGNKLVGSYVVKQYFKYPDRYRLEVLSPEDKKGKTTLYDGSKIWIYHPGINQTYTMEDFKEVEETGMFPGYFARNLFSSEEAQYEVKKEGSLELIVIRVEVPGGNNYRKSQVLYIDREKNIPVKMEILDSSGNIAVTVHYREFIYNHKIDEVLFEKL